MDIKELRERRGAIYHQMKALVDRAQAEGRELTEEETEQHEKLFADQEKLQRQIGAAERQAEIDREMAEARLRSEPDDGDRKSEPGDKPATREALQMEAFRSYLMGGHPSPAAAEAFRALQADADTQGGFLLTPLEVVNQLIKAVDDMVFVRRLATAVQVPAGVQSIGVPSLDADPADSDWTAEIGAGSEDSTMAFGRRELHPWPLAKRLKVSKTLLRRGAMAPEAIVRDRLAYKFAITQEKAFLTGHGANQPLGVFTASANGISTGRDVSTGNTDTSIQADGLIEAKYSLKGGYWPRAQWIFHRDAVKQISKLKDGEGQYLWQPGLQAGQPDRLLSFPVNVSEYAPNTFTTGLYVGILGDFANYWVADALMLEIQRLVELYAETNQDGFIGRVEVDGMPVLEEAFARVKLG